MKKVTLETRSTLTYTPFENIRELVKGSKKDDKKDKKEKSDERKQRI